MHGCLARRERGPLELVGKIGHCTPAKILNGRTFSIQPESHGKASAAQPAGRKGGVGGCFCFGLLWVCGWGWVCP